MDAYEKLKELTLTQQEKTAELTVMLDQCPWLSDPTHEYHIMFEDISKDYKELRSAVPVYLTDDELKQIAKEHREEFTFF